MPANIERPLPGQEAKFTRPVNDTWIAHTISGAFETTGLGRHQPGFVLGADDDTFGEETGSLITKIDGRVAMLTGQTRNFDMFRSLLHAGKKTRSFYEAQSSWTETAPN
ncbi:MAG TPA: hypothetical protein VNA13_00220, partial [Xanthomonadales bacterium]|nr:hypothetical protein [Xanthomonadales bacterium]